MKITPINPQFLFGVPIHTINPSLKTLHFMGPVLASRGDALREAQKTYNTFIEKRQQDIEVNIDDERIAAINVCIESLKQQYKIDQIPDGMDLEVAWQQAFGESFTEEDIQRILVSMRVGREKTQGDLFDMASAANQNPTR